MQTTDALSILPVDCADMTPFEDDLSLLTFYTKCNFDTFTEVIDTRRNDESHIQAINIMSATP